MSSVPSGSKEWEEIEEEMFLDRDRGKGPKEAMLEAGLLEAHTRK